LEDEVLQVKLKQFCEKKQKHADARLSARMFFVKERRFGESIYEETDQLLPVCGISRSPASL
jgi:hypothetical protein